MVTYRSSLENCIELTILCEYIVGIAGTALGLLALSRNGGFNLFGGGNSAPENVNINTLGTGSSGFGAIAPTAFQAWEKGCEDTLALQKGLYDWALTQ